MFSLKNIIFGLFGKADKIADKYKDASGKGINQRYNELLAEEADQYTINAINDFIDNTIVPYRLLEKFIPYMEFNLGAPFIITDPEVRRKLLRFLLRIYSIKSTIPSYDIMFRILGFTVDYYVTANSTLVNNNLYILTNPDGTVYPFGSGTCIINNGITPTNMTIGDKYYVQNDVTTVASFTNGAKLKRQTVIDIFESDFSFDKGNLPGGGFENVNYTFDDASRTFDMNCEGCSKYMIKLFGSGDLDVNTHNAIFRVLEFLEPINAELISVFYNDIILLSNQSISVWIDENGDLMYNNDGAPDITLSLDSNGDLIISGPLAAYYKINKDGNLIFEF